MSKLYLFEEPQVVGVVVVGKIHDSVLGGVLHDPFQPGVAVESPSHRRVFVWVNGCNLKRVKEKNNF